MSDLQAQFEQASQDVNQLIARPDNQTLLRLYALYKQGSVGDVAGDKPSMTDMGRAPTFYDCAVEVQRLD